ncbi:MAG TPA: glycosyltransferase family 9 protein [Solirubrobacteraceae bacterium]|nr:glycosyltransferase family 9 protein [Solirubrobacteraceae bacterium]
MDTPPSTPLTSRPAAGRARSGRGNELLRRLDAALGPALLRLLGRVRRPRPRPPVPQRIGIMKTTGIGDMVLASAVVRDVQDAYPQASIVLLAGPGNAAVARLIDGVTVIAVPTARPLAVIPRIRAARLDMLLDLGQWTRLEALYAAVSGAAWTAGFRTPGFDRHFAYDASVPHSDQVSELENFAAVSRAAGATPRARPAFSPGEASAEPPVPDPYVIFHLWPGGFRSELREWPANRWRELIDRVLAAGYHVVLSGGPDDVERTRRFMAARPVDGVVSIAGEHSFPELLAVLARARCVVSVNTGLMHLAAAVGAPTIALNGPTSAARWGPVGERVVCVDSELPGCGFLNLGFEYDGRRTDCMSGIAVERVAEATLREAHA